jgi:hypothetical protein
VVTMDLKKHCCDFLKKQPNHHSRVPWIVLVSMPFLFLVYVDSCCIVSPSLKLGLEPFVGLCLICHLESHLPVHTALSRSRRPLPSSMGNCRYVGYDRRKKNHNTNKMKSKSSSRKRKAQAQAQAEISHKLLKTSRPISPPTNNDQFEPRSLQTVISEEELEIAVETLTELAKYPGLIKSKPCKNLRVAVHEFRQACTTGVNAAGMSPRR